MPETLLQRLRSEKDAQISGGIYHKVQIELTYNSNHIEGSRLTHDQTRYIMENDVGGRVTTLPGDVPDAMKKLIGNYNQRVIITLEEILAFQYEFETIHPFQDGNGRIGRLIMFKECLRNGVVPFIIEDEIKLYYYRGLSEWKKEKGYLTDMCLSAQDKFKTYLDYFKIPQKNFFIFFDVTIDITSKT